MHQGWKASARGAQPYYHYVCYLRHHDIPYPGMCAESDEECLVSHITRQLEGLSQCEQPHRRAKNLVLM